MKPISEIKPWRDAETLSHLYYDKGYSLKQIGDLFGVHYTTIRNNMGRHGLDRRKKGNIENEYSKEELLEWIDVFVHYFGIAPVDDDLKSWPGPTDVTYRYRFGSVRKAVEEAGYEPRGDAHD